MSVTNSQKQLDVLCLILKRTSIQTTLSSGESVYTLPWQHPVTTSVTMVTSIPITYWCVNNLNNVQLVTDPCSVVRLSRVVARQRDTI